LSRIDKHLEIPLPTKEAREKILDLHIAKKMN
jgi:ATP-dependent 26S proteasome regulatory subunit